MKGTLLDFLKLAAEKPDLARELGDLAARHGFEFSDEVTDDELEALSGGIDQMSTMYLQPEMQEAARTVQTMSSILKQWHDTTTSIINNLRA